MFFRMVYKSGQIFLPFCHNARVWQTDRRTDRILITIPHLHCMQRGKNMQHNPYLWPNWRNFRILKEIGVKEHAGDVRFKSPSGNMAVLCMRNASSHNYRNSLVTVDLAMGHIPHSTESISSKVNNSILVSHQYTFASYLQFIFHLFLFLYTFW